MTARSKLFLLEACFLVTGSGCMGLHPPTEADDVFSSAGPPPKEWHAAVTFDLDDSVRVEFFDGVRSRVVTSRESGQGEFGRTPCYRVHLRDSLATELRVTIGFPGAGITAVEYPMVISKDYFYGIWIGATGGNPRRYMHTSGARSYPIPASAQITPADSLWIFWGATGRECWNCGG